MTSHAVPLVRRTLDWHRPLMYFAWLMAACGVVSVVGLLVDDRMLTGAPVWLKPLKFSISLGVYAATWAWLISLQKRPRRWIWWTGTGVAVLLAVGEMTIIMGQAFRGRLSHFNADSTFDAVLFSVMGASIAVVWVLNLAQSLILLRERLSDRVLTLGIRLGLGLSLIGMAVAFFMVGPTPEQLDALQRGAQPGAIGAHSVGVPDGGPGLPITGWSTVGGDLRVPHFVGIHALQALPLLAFGLTTLARRARSLRAESVRRRLVLAGGVGYAGLLGITTWQALRGQSVVAPDALTLAAAAGVVVATTAIALSARRSRLGKDSVELAA